MIKNIPQKGFPRVWAAFVNSLAGLKSCFQNEAAFRQELFLVLLLGPALLMLPVSILFKTVLLMVTVLVLIVEILNSAIEAVVDLVSPEFHELAKRAKDMGSAAVFLSLILAGTAWGLALFRVFISPVPL